MCNNNKNYFCVMYKSCAIIYGNKADQKPNFLKHHRGRVVTAVFTCSLVFSHFLNDFFIVCFDHPIIAFSNATFMI